MGVVIGNSWCGVAIFLSIQLANNTIESSSLPVLLLPSVIFAEREGNLILLSLGFLLGMFVEWATGMGTSFGLGMYLKVPFTLPMLIGGYARDSWEIRTQVWIDKIKQEHGSNEAENKGRLFYNLYDCWPYD